MEALQAADFAGIIVAQFQLTSEQMRVNSQSFFDISNVFPVGGEYRDPSCSHGSTAKLKTAGAGNGAKRTRQKSEAARGLARIYSELLVEEN